MIDIKKEQWKSLLHHEESLVIFVHTPFCATCQLAERMLAILEESDQAQFFYRMNASFFPEFMKENKIQSVPALLLVKDGLVVDQLYAFESVTKLHAVLEGWKQKQSI
ncbi:thioredoxin family protein [Gracilibacillus thailandensis]|uniref:Thioredoxin n=1 Tax=Gracilibacillus thailandensis TaxID=563735 RepID=A0A6N7R483_9BACI|nr:thioredoxin family protein [Gracilibacillus thailandensis]MRI68007.1 thioredoxin [Gracilibacillus thailandensis]